MDEHKKHKVEQDEVTLVRVMGKDIRGDKKLLAGITQIQGISWAFAGAICKKTGINKNIKIQDLSKEDLEKLEEFIRNPEIPSFMKNRQKDFEDGEDKHIIGSDLKLRNEFDVKRLRKIKSYRGSRHAANLPVRGQKTKSNFRRHRKPSVASAKKKDKK